MYVFCGHFASYNFSDMLSQLIGRTKERATLLKALTSPEPEMVAVIGRRRVGKTFLVRSVYEGAIDLEFTGLQDANTRAQIENFHFLLSTFAGPASALPVPSTWMEAFRQLITVLREQPPIDRKRVLFFDELPWLASKRSGFLSAFGFFWNNWASKHPIVVVICGSAASWMIQKVVQNRGGLHNRITKRIHLMPFSIGEAEAFFSSRNIKLNRYQIAQLYMIMGGIPHYLKEVEAGKSAAQNIDAICFTPEGLLRDEFDNLYQALFEQADNHIAVVRALGQKWRGLTRKEIVKQAQLPEGGGATKVLRELTHSGFISAYFPFGKKQKDKLYRLTDEYSLFYLHFIEGKREQEPGLWKQLSQTPIYKAWSGYAFESLCLKHAQNIKKALGIEGVYTENSAFSYRGDTSLPGIQIDLLIDRNDQVINVCEMKFHSGAFTIDKAYAAQLRQKVEVFREVSKTRKQLFLTLITTFGLNANKHSIGLVDTALDLDALFDG